MKNVVKRVLIMGLLILFFYLLQTIVLSKIPYVAGVPNLMLILTLSVGLLRGRSEGMAVGFVCGLLLDVFSGGVLCFYALIYMYIGYLNGILANILVSELLLLPLLSCACSELLYHAYQYIFGFFVQNKLHFVQYFKQIVLPEFMLTVTVSIIGYYLILVINRRLEQAEQKGAKKFA